MKIMLPHLTSYTSWDDAERILTIDSTHWYQVIEKYFSETGMKEPKILDVGCGKGVLVEVFRHGGYDMQGIELDGFYSKNLPPEGIVIYDGNVLPYKDNTFDIVIAKYVLHHIEKQGKLIDEMIRVSNNSIIIIEEVYQTFWQKVLIYFRDVIFNYRFSHKLEFHFNKYFRVGEIKQLFLGKKLKVKIHKLFPQRGYHAEITIMHK